MTRLLLYVCCAPDATVAIERLRADFDITMFFYNPNVHPREEYDRRLEAARQLGRILQVKVLEGDYDPSAWFDAVKGLEQEPERGRRCEICLRER
ncbi:MAG: epoxyqueuosine reductase QueH, partial [Proteobacteria bacterium]|nr:epoxyqueuosine reductase QueH [Pseudomonadota bacterium]